VKGESASARSRFHRAFLTSWISASCSMDLDFVLSGFCSCALQISAACFYLVLVLSRFLSRVVLILASCSMKYGLELHRFWPFYGFLAAHQPCVLYAHIVETISVARAFFLKETFLREIRVSVLVPLGPVTGVSALRVVRFSSFVLDPPGACQHITCESEHKIV
jgi:hypothetical protein